MFYDLETCSFPRADCGSKSLNVKKGRSASWAASAARASTRARRRSRRASGMPPSRRRPPGGFDFLENPLCAIRKTKSHKLAARRAFRRRKKNPAVRQGHLQAGDALRRPVEGHRHQRQDHPRPGVQGALGLHQEEGPPGVSILSKIHCVRFGWNRHGEQLLHAPETEWQNLRASTRAAPSARSTASGTAARCSR